MLLYDYLKISAHKYPLKTAVITEFERINYFELWKNCLKFASAIKNAGLKPGGRVILYLDNSISYVMAYFGVLLAGGVVVGQSTANKKRQLKNIINHCEATGIITSGPLLPMVDDVVPECDSLKFVFYDRETEDPPNRKTTGKPPENIAYRCFLDVYLKEKPDCQLPMRNVEELAQIIYTSGTTGNPKGVMLSHKNLMTNTESIIEYLHLAPEDRVMVVLPFYYSYGNSLLLTHIACGGSLVIDNRFAYPQKVLSRMSEEKVTGFAGVPSTFAILTHKAGLKNFDLSSLRYITQAGGPMSPSLASELRGALQGIKIYIMYGQTEASARLSYLEPEKLLEKPGSIGKAIPGVELKVVGDNGKEISPGETGEIVANGDNIMMGYWRNKAETEKVLKPDGLHTGDLATIDEDGYLYIISRKSDIIKSGAHRISPKEIEEVIMEDGRVHEVAVVGEPDDVLGEVVAALVVPRPGAELTVMDIFKRCRENLPHYKVPRRIEFREALAKTAAGKIKKVQLKNELVESLK